MTDYLIKLLVVYPMMVGLITLELILFAVILYYANHEGGKDVQWQR